MLSLLHVQGIPDMPQEESGGGEEPSAPIGGQEEQQAEGNENI
jgi:hypothetical protein